MFRQWALPVLVASLLVVGLIGPASATTIQISTELAKDQTQLVWGCPAGERFVSGTADWYRREGAKLLTTTQAVADPNDPTSGVYVVPKGARFVSFTQECAPATQTVTLTGVLDPGVIVTADCPPETPYLVSVAEVVAFVPGSGDPLSLSYEQTAIGVRFWLGLEGYSWRVTMTCSSFPQ
jgi:hypothetical protein